MGYYEWKKEQEKKKKEGKSNYQQWRAQTYGRNLSADMQSRLQSWMDEHNAFLTDYSDRFGGRNADWSFIDYVGDAGDYYSSVTERGKTLNDTASQLLADLQRDSYIYGDDYVKAVSEMLTSGRDLYSGVADIAKSDVDFWSKFDPTEEQIAAGYDSAEKVYNAWRTDNKYREKYAGMTYDEVQQETVALNDEEEAEWVRNYLPTLWGSNEEEASYVRADKKAQEAEDLLNKYERLKLIGGDEYAALTREIGIKYGGVKELRQAVTQLRADATQKGRNAENMRLAEVSNPNAATYDPEFDNLAAYDSAIKDDVYTYLNMDEDARAKYVNDQMVYSTVPGDTSHIDANNNMRAKYEKLDQLSADEIAVYNYYVNTGATDKAAAYLELLGDTMNARIGTNIFSHIEGQPLAELAYSAVAGIDQFKSGMEGLGRSFVGDDSYTPTSALQYAGGMAREDLGNVDLKWYDFKEGGWKDADIFGSSLGQGLYDLGTTTANMAPSILTSTAIGLINPVAGQIAGVSLLGGSAAGNAYQEKINLGYSADSARAYGYMVGLSEAVLEYAIGGISKLGGKAMGAISTKMLDKIDNVLARVAKTTGGKLLMAGISEGVEEGLQSIIEPYIWQAVSGEEAKVDWEETLYSSLLGFMSGGMFEGVEIASKNAQQNAQTKEYYGESQQELVTEALEIDPANAYAKKMQKILDSGKDLTGKQLGKLVQQNDAAISQTADRKMEYQSAKINNAILRLVERVKNGLSTKGEKVQIQTVTDEAAERIQQITGVDVHGYKVAIEARQIEHILKDHGENGASDRSMANPEDIAKIEYTLESPDAINPAGSTKAYVTVKDGKMKPADTVIYEKVNGDGSYYVVQAVPDTKKKTLYVVTAFIGKSGYKNTEATQSTNANSPGATPAAESAVASNTSISNSVPGVNGENVDPLAQLAREAVDARYDAENGAGLDGISAEGRAIYQDQAVDVVDIDTAGGGKVMVKLADGRSVDATALEYADSGEAELWRVIGKYAENAEAARALWEEYKLGNLDAYMYARGIEEAFLFGKNNIPQSEMDIKDNLSNLLSPRQRKEAYTQGRIAGEMKAQQRQDKLDAAKKKGNNKKGKLHFEGDRDSLTARQKVSLQTCEIVAKALGIQVYVFESERSAGTKRVGDNGWYDPKDGSIHIDLHAGQNGEGVMVFTLAHELTHFIRDWSPAKFRTLSGFLAEQYAKKGQSVADLVRDQQRMAEADGRSLSFEEAHEEWVADSMETMLTDGTIVEKLAMLQAKDKGLVAKIKSFLDGFLKRLKAAYQGVSPQTQEGQIVGEMVDAAQELQDLFADALMDAGENFRTAEKNTTGEGGVRFMSREDSTRIKQQIDAVAEQLNKMDVVVSVVSDDFAGMRDSDIAKKLEQEFSKFGNRVERQNFGVILLEYKQLNKALNYLKLPGEKAALLTVPRVLKRGIQADFHTKHKDRGVDSYTFAAPVEINGKRGNVGVVVQRVTGTNRFKTLRILLPNGKAFEFVKNNEADSTTGSSSKQKGSEGIPIESASKVSIRNPDGIVKENDSTEKRSSSRSGAVSDRTMLVDLFEQMVTDSNEYKALQKYKKNIDQMLALEEKIQRLTDEIKRVSFSEGPRNMEHLDNIKQQRKQAVAELNRFDNILLGLEKSGVLRAMIERNRKTIQQETRDQVREYYRQKNETRETEIREYYRESRRKAVERHNQAEVRQRIRKDVQRLDSLLNKGTKEKNVKLELKEFAGAALRTAKGTFLKNYNEYEMVRSGVNATMSREQKAVFARAQELLKELDHIWEQRENAPAADNLHEKWDPEAQLRRDDHEEALKKELAKNMKVLRDAGIFQLENELMEDANSDQLMDELMAAYVALKNSEAAHVRGVYSEAVYGQFEKIKDFLGGKAIKDMTAIELAELHKMYRMVLHTISHSNDLFAQKRKGDVRKLGEEVISQLQTPGKEMTAEVLDKLAKMGWANLKPETALELIGSDALTEMMQGLYRGEDTYALDIDHARKYAEEQGKKYGRDKWDMKKSLAFANTKITLGEAMSLYAYTRRQQAQGHLEGDGFTHSANVRIKEPVGKLPVELSYIRNATKTHSVPKDVFDRVAQLLTPEQKKYVEAMQEYLSQVMGSKGNEVSMQLYGIKLFEETMYFPLKTAQEYHDEALGATTGEVKLKNSGFTKKVQEKASNPIVLDDFESVWAAHVDKMSLYHGFVLPMEDFDRVYNYHHQVEQDVTDAWGEVYKKEKVDTNETVKVDIQNKMGKAANDYIEDFMRQLNGGVRTDSTEKLFSSGVRKFKKAAVLASLSVAVQQPTAFVRAMAYLDLADVADWKNWLGKKGKPEGKLLDEMYKYAPVALMKHIGGFDPSLGRSTQNYIFKEKGVMNAIDTVAGWLPEHMDQWTWTYIWVCTKRQIHRQNPDLKVNSKAFLEKAGERFSKIIRDTQVYDSVLTKSQLMRSKSVFLQMATAFMNEPTTSMDMYIRSTIQAKKGKISKKQAARTWGAVIGSQILVAAVSAFVYAARDDDEDETYWEKYVSSFIGKAKEGLMPWYSVPFVKDIISVFEGYSSERSDMSLITDLYQGWQKLQSDKATPWEKVEAFAGSILNCFGIPLKNVSRDVRAIFNTVKTWGDVQGTGTGMKYAAIEGLTGKEVAKKEQMAQAVAKGDTAHIIRLMATYDSEDSAASAVRSGVKDAYLQGKITEDVAAEFMQAYAGEDAVDAWDKVTEWKAEVETGIAYDDIKDKFISGEITEEQAKEMYVAYGGYDEEEALEKVTEMRAEKETGIAYGDIKDKFISGEISKKQAKEMYITYGGHDEEDAEKKVTYWEFLKEHPESELDQGPALKYVEFAEPAGISLKIYTQYAEATADLESDKDKDGKTVTSRQKKVWAEIHKLPLTKKQKDALHYAAGYKESSLDDAPWH